MQKVIKIMTISIFDSRKLFLLLIIIQLSCINSINPYTNKAESKVTLCKESVQNGDTVSVNITYQLIVGVQLKEFINYFRIIMDENAGWTDTTVKIETLVSNPINFDVQFTKTGIYRFSIHTAYHDQTTSQDNYIVYVDSTAYKEMVRNHPGNYTVFPKKIP